VSHIFGLDDDIESSSGDLAVVIDKFDNRMQCVGRIAEIDILGNSCGGCKTSHFLAFLAQEFEFVVSCATTRVNGNQFRMVPLKDVDIIYNETEPDTTKYR